MSECPYCGEQIATGAKKCRFCMEFLPQGPHNHVDGDPAAPPERISPFDRVRMGEVAAEASGISHGGVVVGISWMVLISLLLFFLPFLGQFIAGIIGGKKAGNLLNAIMAAIAPSLLLASLLLALASRLTGIPVIGGLATAGALTLAFAGAGPLLLGAVIGGFLAPGDEVPVSRPALVFVGMAALFLGWRLVMQVRATLNTARNVATIVDNVLPSSDQQEASTGASQRLDRASALAGELLTRVYEAKSDNDETRTPTRAWATYRNSRFPFAFDYPADGLILENESGSGDGATFKSPDEVIRVRAYAFVTEETWRDCASLGPPHGGDITYERQLADGCVISGTFVDSVFYIRAVSPRPDMAAVLEVSYPPEARSRVDQILPRMANSLRFR